EPTIMSISVSQQHLTWLRPLDRCTLLPIVTVDEVDAIVRLGEVLVDVALPLTEVTLRFDSALEAIAQLAANSPSLEVGAGTVRTVDQAIEAVNSGARFLVSPGLSPDIVNWCLENEVPILPGAVTPTEIMLAQSLGLSVLKFFPAMGLKAAEMLLALQGPFPEVRFVPTGGIDESSFVSILQLPNRSEEHTSELQSRENLVCR